MDATRTRIEILGKEALEPILTTTTAHRLRRRERRGPPHRLHHGIGRTGRLRAGRRRGAARRSSGGQPMTNAAIRPRRTCHTGFVLASGLAIDTRLAGEAAARERILTLFSPGTEVFRVGPFVIGIFASPMRIEAGAAPGTPLVRHGRMHRRPLSIPTSSRRCRPARTPSSSSTAAKRPRRRSTPTSAKTFRPGSMFRRSR